MSAIYELKLKKFIYILYTLNVIHAGVKKLPKKIVKWKKHKVVRKKWIWYATTLRARARQHLSLAAVLKVIEPLFMSDKARPNSFKTCCTSHFLVNRVPGRKRGIIESRHNDSLTGAIITF